MLLISLVSISVWIADVVIVGISLRTTTLLGFHPSESPKRHNNSCANLSHDNEEQRMRSNCNHGIAGPDMALMATSTRVCKGVLLMRKYWFARGLIFKAARNLQVPALAFDANNFSLWGSGEWWMFLAAQSMASGTVMVRWVSKYSDPVMATGWHMVIGGLPLMAIAILKHDPALSSFHELTTGDVLALLYTSIFGSAISYGVYFYNATRGSLTKLSSLTFLTPMFASLFGRKNIRLIYQMQLAGAVVTIAALYMVNYKSEAE
ncbi:hypothetical protein SASPL_101749 [Salvia splendens]|uniref:EamA domain-containing protein n=1 Tax=Salvia splendens TaxID=180675 RepID=A0A8X8YPY4_SALSN|nr:hypothetical protein SASPL_101749 [Salvia splendens]